MDSMEYTSVYSSTGTCFELGLCLMPLSTIFQFYIVYRGVSFIGGGNWSTRRKPQTLSHNVVSSTPRLSGIHNC